MKFKNMFRRKVDYMLVTYILKSFIKSYNNCKIVIHYEITRSGVIKLYTNKPGLIIGRGGENIRKLTEKMKRECNVKNVKLYEMKHIISNCGVF